MSSGKQLLVTSPPFVLEGLAFPLIDMYKLCHTETFSDDRCSHWGGTSAPIDFTKPRPFGVSVTRSQMLPRIGQESRFSGQRLSIQGQRSQGQLIYCLASVHTSLSRTLSKFIHSPLSSRPVSLGSRCGWLWYCIGKELKLQGVKESFAGKRVYFSLLLVLDVFGN